MGLFLFLKLRDSKADVGFGQGGPYQVYRIRWPEKCQTGRPGGQMRWARANGPVPTKYLRICHAFALDGALTFILNAYVT